MSKSVKRRKPASSVGTMFCVAGRVFSSRDEAVAYCKAQRISVVRIEMVSIEASKLVAGEAVQLRVYFAGAEPVLLLSSVSGEVVSYPVRMSDLVDVVSSVKARSREVARAGALV